MRKSTLTESGDSRRRGDRSARATSRLVLLVAAFVLSGVAACDPIFALRGTVTVAPALQREFSTEHRGRVVVTARHQGGGFAYLSWATLCEPTDTPLVVPFALQKTGCAYETRVQARLERVLETDPSKIPACGSKGQAVVTHDDALVAAADKTVLPGKTGCDDADVAVDLELPAP